jgi:hypothetical protein
MPTLGNGRPLSATLPRLPRLRGTIAARCAEIGEDIVSYLRRISLPVAATHGNEIEADAVEDYVDALMAERLTAEPLLLTRAAEPDVGR